VLDCPRCAAALDLTLRDCRRCGADARPAIPAGVGLVCRRCATFHDPGHAWCSACSDRLADAERGAANPQAPPTVLVPPPAPSTEAPRLRALVVRPDGTRGAPTAVGPGALVCGRSAALAIDDPAASGTHLRLTPAGETAIAEDLGARSGTFVRLRDPATLGSAAEIRVGRQRLRLELHRTTDGSSGPGMLVQLWPDGRAKAVFPLRSGPNVLGRDIGDVSFPSDRSISARHARITVNPDSAVVEDLGSSNGTFVRLTGPTRVRAGDQLLVGNQLLAIERLA
jgi:pSer/pThr/pTyr-binding forkhead associated (FHA) protein